MDQHLNQNYMGHQQYPMAQDMMPNQQHANMYYQNDPGYMPNQAPPVQQNPVPHQVDFSSLQPDPSVMQFSGGSFNPSMNSIPMPLLPTEPLPNMNPKPSPKSESKKKTPTKSKRNSNQGSPGQVPHKMIPEYVHKLLEKRKEAFTDKEFAERALSNLARKLASQANVLDEWLRAITHEDINSSCVCVPRPKDGRMTITKATSNAGCKKVFPQIFVCQVFRFPQIVFHNDIKSADHCLNPGLIKPPNAATAKDDDEGREVICINPYHYVLSTEAETRFKKQSSKQSKTPKVLNNDSNSSFSVDDDEESDDEILHYEDDGTDYAQLWDQKVRQEPPGKELHPFEINRMLKELNIFTLNKELKKITPADQELLESLGVVKQLESMIASGDYFKHLQEKYGEKVQNVPVQALSDQCDQVLMPPPSISNQFDMAPQANTSRINPVELEEDSAIQNLLDDIQTSFERQFDDEFNDLNETAKTDDSGGGSESRASSPFGNINIGTTFSITDGQALEDLAASAEDLLTSSPDEMPLEGLSIPQEVFDNFLEASASDVDHFPFPGSDPNQPF